MLIHFHIVIFTWVLLHSIYLEFKMIQKFGKIQYMKVTLKFTQQYMHLTPYSFQTFGGKNLLHVGVILQRSVLILLLFCLPCWALLINTHPILLLLGQDPEVARYIFLCSPYQWFSLLEGVANLEKNEQLK